MRHLLPIAAALALCPALAHADDPPPGPRLTKPPTLIRFVDAVYPESEKAAGRAAAVVLQLDIGLDGKVTAVAVHTSAGAAFDAAAVAAARQFVFTAAEVDGAPSPVRILYQYDFKLAVEVAKKTTADFAGSVVDRATGRPLAGVSIDLGDGRVAVTDAQGRFALADLPPGAHGVALSGPGITALATQETLTAGERLDVTYQVSPETAGPAEESDDLEIVVVAPPLEKSAASTSVVAGQARQVPGTGGDVLKVVESMPGVGRAAAGSGALVVWGASPADTRVYVDGVRIPRLYHSGGLRSVVAADLVESIELVPGAYGAPYGRGLGGLVLVGLKPMAEEHAGAIASDVIDSSAAVRVPLGRRVSLEAAARQSQLGWLLDQVTDEEVSALFPIASYTDAQLRAGFRLSPRETLEVGLLGSTDAVTRSVASTDPDATESREQRTDFARLWLRYHRDLADGNPVDVTGYVGGDVADLRDRFGAAPTEQRTASKLFGLRASWRGRVGKRIVVTTGLDGEVAIADLRRTGSVSTPPREGDVVVFGQPPPDQLAFDEWSAATGSLAPFVQADIALWEDRLHIVPGLRLDPSFVSVSRRTPVEGATPSVGAFSEDTHLEPRLAIDLAATPWLSLRAAGGRFHQAPQVEDLSAVFGSPTLPSSSATHWLLGGAVKLSETLTTEVTAFMTTSSELATRSPLATPLLAQALVPDGTGRVVGAQVMIRQALARGLFGWVSYSISRSERTDGPGAAPRLFDHDQTHVATAVAAWDLGRGFELGARLRYATGVPRTEVTGAFFDDKRDVFQPLFGEHNGERIPAFIQADLRAAKKWDLGGQALEAYLDVQNVSNRENAEEIIYNADFSEKRYIRGLPLVPVIGARLTW